MSVAIGVDSHKSSLAAAALDELGRVVGVREFANDERGHDALLGWAKAEAEVRIIGIEGAGSFGAGLARHLLDVGEVVYEVPAFLSYRERKRNPPRASPIPRTRSPSRASPPGARGCHRRGARMFSWTSSCCPTTVTSSFAPAPG